MSRLRNIYYPTKSLRTTVLNKQKNKKEALSAVFGSCGVNLILLAVLLLSLDLSSCPNDSGFPQMQTKKLLHDLPTGILPVPESPREMLERGIPEITEKSSRHGYAWNQRAGMLSGARLSHLGAPAHSISQHPAASRSLEQRPRHQGRSDLPVMLLQCHGSNWNGSGMSNGELEPDLSQELAKPEGLEGLICGEMTCHKIR